MRFTHPRAGLGQRHAKRIVMNPPQSFLEASAVSNPASNGPANSPVVFGQNGQAVLVGAEPAQEAGNANGATQAQAQPAEGAADGNQMAQAVAQVQSQTSQVATNTIETTTQAAPPTTTASPTTSDNQQAPSPSLSNTDASSLSGLTVSSAASLSAMSIIASPSSANPSSTSITVSTSSNFASISPSSSSASASASASASVLAAARPFTRSPLFIVLCVLGSLVILSVIATSLSWIVRRSGGRCCVCCDHTRSHEDDGLSDVVDSFHSHSYDRQPSMMSMSTCGTNGPSTAHGLGFTNDSTPGVAGAGTGPSGVERIDDKDQRELHRRSTTLAKYPEQSPYLHSGYAEGFPVLHDVEDVRDEKGMHGPQSDDRLGPAWAPLHPGNATLVAGEVGTGPDDTKSIVASGQYANLGPLEIRNLSPGDFDKESTIYNWARQTTIRRNQSHSTVTRANSTSESCSTFPSKESR